MFRTGEVRTRCWSLTDMWWRMSRDRRSVLMRLDWKMMWRVELMRFWSVEKSVRLIWCRVLMMLWSVWCLCRLLDFHVTFMIILWRPFRIWKFSTVPRLLKWKWLKDTDGWKNFGSPSRIWIPANYRSLRLEAVYWSWRTWRCTLSPITGGHISNSRSRLRVEEIGRILTVSGCVRFLQEDKRTL